MCIYLIGTSDSAASALPLVVLTSHTLVSSFLLRCAKANWQNRWFTWLTHRLRIEWIKLRPSPRWRTHVRELRTGMKISRMEM